jgi:predicted aspartyl protease
MSPKITYAAFRQEYHSFIRNLMSDVKVISTTPGLTQKNMIVKALWDTGATNTAITPQVAKALSLLTMGTTRVSGANNTSVVDISAVSLVLPNGVPLRDIRTLICTLSPQYDMLIGMDIIMLGDFSISNGGGKTLFSFAIPPFPDTFDLLDKATAVNRNNL